MSTLARITAIISLSPVLIFACLWDSDTIRDEIQARPSLFELVTGHLPHHGTAYYEARVDRLEPKRDRSREETNDLAVALIRLGRFDEAAAMILDALDTGFIEGDGPYYPQARTEIRPRPSRGFRDRLTCIAMSPDSVDAAARAYHDLYQRARSLKLTGRPDSVHL